MRIRIVISDTKEHSAITIETSPASAKFLQNVAQQLNDEGSIVTMDVRQV